APSDFARAQREKKERQVAFWDAIAPQRDAWRRRGRAYHDEVLALLRFLIPRGSRVLEIGCATGDILNALEPARGVGVDFSRRMVELARQKYPALEFVVGDAEALDDALKGEEFDWIVMSDLVGHLSDVWRALRETRAVARPNTRLVVTWYSFLWE